MAFPYTDTSLCDIWDCGHFTTREREKPRLVQVIELLVCLTL